MDVISFILKMFRNLIKHLGIPEENFGKGKRAFLFSLFSLGAASLEAQPAGDAQNPGDGGLGVLVPKQNRKRRVRVLPCGAVSLAHLERHCTACQLCVSACPSHVLRPSLSLDHFLQPEAGFEKGYCRWECTECSMVCPTGAILGIGKEEKSSIRTGVAVVVRELCIVQSSQDECGNCARHCPSAAILMVPSDAADSSSPRVPAVNEQKCTGCGCCEYLCPSNPLSAIYVEGYEQHVSS